MFGEVNLETMGNLRCTITGGVCDNVYTVKDQYGVKYGRCKKAQTYLWNIEKCDDEKPIVKKKRL